MKLELKENMYVRTKKGNIYKFETNNSMAKNGAKKYMINCSYNIIDILEIGDYVNGSKVVEVDFDAEEEKYIRIDKAQDGLKTILRNNDIKSIVTKEMYSSVEYRMETN